MNCPVCNTEYEHFMLHVAESFDQAHYDAIVLPMVRVIKNNGSDWFAFEIAKKMQADENFVGVSGDIHALTSFVSRVIVACGFSRRKSIGLSRKVETQVTLDEQDPLFVDKIKSAWIKSVPRTVKVSKSVYFKSIDKLKPFPFKSGHVVEITKIFRFAAGHHLPEHPRLCQYTHGHEWKLEVTVIDEVDPSTGMVLDFSTLKSIVSQNIIDVLDHNYINDILWNPTAENLCAWIIDELFMSGLNNICRVKLWEAEDSFAVMDAGRLFV